nr:lamin tail domain-containing protein [Helcobacillus sp. ACRRO]
MKETHVSPLWHAQARRTPAFSSRTLAAAALSCSIVIAPAVLPAGVAPSVIQSASAAAPETWPLIVTEIAPDNSGVDNFEFIEVTNPGTEPATIGDGGLALSYIYADSADTSKDVPLTVESPVTVEPGETVVLWLNYTSTTVDTSAYTADDFRAAWGIDADTRVEKIEGQPGMANGGERGIRISDASGSEVVRAFYPTGSVGAGKTIHFRTPADAAARSLDVFASLSAPTAGTVDPQQLDDRPAPEDPEKPSDPDPGAPDPTDPGDPAPTIPGPGPDTTVGHLMITELVPDSTNVGGSDGYEFIEIYNPTTEPISLADYQLRYLYPTDDLTITNAAVWPMSPGNAVVEPGKTVVAWVKNGPNADLTKEDFAKNYNVDPNSFELVEIESAGMANGSIRGMEIQTRAGDPVHRVFYNVGGADDTGPDAGIHYTVDPKDFATGMIMEKSAATPGSAQPGQVPSEPVALNPDTAAPKIEDRSPASIDPSKDAQLTFAISDDVQVRRVEVSLSSSSDATPQVHNLTRNADGTFTLTIPQADLTGKKHFEYSVAASDGTHESTLDAVRVPVDGADTDPLRLNLTDGQFVNGTVPVSAATDSPSDEPEVCVDGTTLTGAKPSLETSPVFAFEASQTDTYFRNGVLVGDDVLHVFDEGLYDKWATISTDVPLTYVTQGKNLQLDIAAGTKAKPGIDENENNDDFTVRNVRLILPDGRTLRAPGWDNPDTIIQMGDSAGKVDILNAKFDIPSDVFTARSADWDTTTVADGEHTVCGIGPDGSRVERTVIVDNTGPEITSPIADGAELRGEFPVDFSATDTGSGLESVNAALDGEPVESGTTFSSLTMKPGTHTLVITAKDTVGNTSKKTITFTTPLEQPSGEIVTEPGAELSVCTDSSLTAQVSDPSGDALDVSFREGHSASLSNGTLNGTGGAVQDADQSERTGAEVSAGRATTSDDALPFHAFTTPVPEGSPEDSLIRVAWSGTTDPGARVRLLVWNTDKSAYEEVDVTLTDSKSGAGTLEAMVPLAGHTVDGEIRAVVQHSEGWAGKNLSDRSTAVTPHHPDDTPRSDYDFTFGWESDTQYYNESYFESQLAIHDYFLDRRDEMNLQYVFHTGDIVDEADKQYQWDNADQAYRMLDDAQLPYGVLAGNHDVGHLSNDFTAYSKHFGEARYAGNPWYGGSYKDNRGHYDLISAGGHDFIMLYMGWDPGDEEIAWMNEVLAKYPERTAFINLHEYMLTTGGLGPVPQRIYDEVVATNPNVRAVMSGHYHDAYTRVDTFDDDGDGTKERTVTQMLFDYQGLPEGGEGFLRLMHFDNQGEKMIARTYSPVRDIYNSEDPSLEPEHQEFQVSYADLGLEPRTKSLTSTDARIDVLTSTELGAVKGAASPSEVSVDVKELADGTHSFYVLTTDPYGAKHYSPVQDVTVKGEDCDVEELPETPENPSDPKGPGTSPAPGKPSKPQSPTVPGQPVANDPRDPEEPGKPAGPGVSDEAGHGSAPGDAQKPEAGTAGASGQDATAGSGRDSRPQSDSAQSAREGFLPRTGTEAAGLIAAAVVLIAAGAAVIRLRRSRR